MTKDSKSKFHQVRTSQLAALNIVSFLLGSASSALVIFLLLGKGESQKEVALDIGKRVVSCINHKMDAYTSMYTDSGSGLRVIQTDCVFKP